MDKPVKDTCTISVMFPAESDEQAIDVKKKVNEIVADIPESRTVFNIISNKATKPMG